MKKNIKLLAMLMLSFGLFEAVQANDVTINVVNNSNCREIIHRHYKNGSWGSWSVIQPMTKGSATYNLRGNATYNLSESEHDEYATQLHTFKNYVQKDNATNEHKGNAFKGKTTWDIATNTIR